MVDDIAIIESYDPSVGWLNAMLVHRVPTWSLGETFTFTARRKCTGAATLAIPLRTRNSRLSPLQKAKKILFRLPRFLRNSIDERFFERWIFGIVMSICLRDRYKRGI